jgi:phosphatidylserine decarboxylase
MTMRLRGKSGEAVMLILMGAMIVGGIIVWLATGDLHMMPMHGKKHEKAGTVLTNHHGSRQDPAVGQSEGDEVNGAEQGTEARPGVDAP